MVLARHGKLFTWQPRHNAGLILPAEAGWAFPNCAVSVPHDNGGTVPPGKSCAPEVTTSYTSLISLSADTALVSYDRLSNGTGPSRAGCWGAEDAVYTMTIKVTPARQAAPISIIEVNATTSRASAADQLAEVPMRTGMNLNWAVWPARTCIRCRDFGGRGLPPSRYRGGWHHGVGDESGPTL